ncbi:hypothetical protein HPB50_008000 [Hyalomma asiaticum]|uniref:Uncharacterized protein n=1 Tax=Hyalomma asiaticum TaxID=266040 RepID=A0ACB7RUV7_HYAAI|nr:hypothetical protein HPB50_008000 [Hyalomma asiaticum]
MKAPLTSTTADLAACPRPISPDGSIWRPGPSARICSRHFVGNEKSNIEKHPAYNPSIFPSHYRYTPPTHAVDRYER